MTASAWTWAIVEKAVALGKEQRSPGDGGAGFLWLADFLLQGRSVDVARLWHDSDFRAVKPYLVHFNARDPYDIGFTFAAVDEDAKIADSLVAAFDAVLMTASRGPDQMDDHVWRRRAAATDYRVIPRYGWGFVDQYMLRLSIFSSGGAVRETPTW